MASSSTVVLHPFTKTLIRIKARQLCRRSDFSTSDREDIEQGMSTYLVEKAHLYDPNRGTIEAFVIVAVDTWIGMHLRYRARDCRREGFRAVSLDAAHTNREGESATLGAFSSNRDLERRTGSSSRSEHEMFELREAIDRVSTRIQPDDRALLIDVVKRGVTGAARHRGVSRRRISNALARLRPLFENSGLGPK